MVKSCQKGRLLHEEYPLKMAARDAVVTFLIANSVFYIFQYLLFNFIDGELPILQKAMIESQKMEIIENYGEKFFKQMMEQDFTLTARKSIIAFGQSTIGGFILSFLIAAILKKD